MRFSGIRQHEFPTLKGNTTGGNVNWSAKLSVPECGEYRPAKIARLGLERFITPRYTPASPDVSSDAEGSN